jgi:hypothetical protein
VVVVLTGCLSASMCGYMLYLRCAGVAANAMDPVARERCDTGILRSVGRLRSGDDSLGVSVGERFECCTGLTNTIETAIETPQVGNVRLERWLESCHWVMQQVQLRNGRIAKGTRLEIYIPGGSQKEVITRSSDDGSIDRGHAKM